MFKKCLADSAPVLILVATASACLGIAALPAGAVAAPEGVPETVEVHSAGTTTAEVLGAVTLPAKTEYQISADYALASETWCTTHGASGSPSTRLGSVRKSSGVRETFSVRLEALLPSHEYCAAAAVTVPPPGPGTASGEQKTFTTASPPPSPPQFFINGKKATTKHEAGFSFGEITLTNKTLAGLECKSFFSQQRWNEVREGTERGFQETTGYATWECKAGLACEVTNERGVKKEGIFLSAEGPPDLVTEKARRNGNTSLPWDGELTEKEPQAGTTAFFTLTHHVKIWYVIPLGTEMGGAGVGPGCALGGNEIAFEDKEGPTEKAKGLEEEPKGVNGGGRSPLFPSHGLFEGEKTEKSGAFETGALESSFGLGITTGKFVTAGATAFELVEAK
jgi:hypothetical protein